MQKSRLFHPIAFTIIALLFVVDALIAYLDGHLKSIHISGSVGAILAAVSVWIAEVRYRRAINNRDKDEVSEQEEQTL